MSKHSILSILLLVMVMAFAFCWVGCSSEEEEDTTASTTPAAEGPETDLQKPVPAVEKTKTEPEKVSPAVEEPETEQKSTAAIEKDPDEPSGDKPPQAEIVLLSKLWETHTRGAVKLTHENHIKVHKIRCSECHHVYEDGKNVWEEGMPAAKCETCHNELTVKGEKKLPPDDQKKNLKLAFHNNCRGCHKEVKKENPETKAPLKCSQCHEKKQ